MVKKSRNSHVHLIAISRKNSKRLMCHFKTTIQVSNSMRTNIFYNIKVINLMIQLDDKAKCIPRIRFIFVITCHVIRTDKIMHKNKTNAYRIGWVLLNYLERYVSRLKFKYRQKKKSTAQYSVILMTVIQVLFHVREVIKKNAIFISLQPHIFICVL